MKTFGLVLNALVVITCYIAMFYCLFNASWAMDAKDIPLATRYGVLAVFFLVYVCWMDIQGRFHKLQAKLDAKTNGG